MSRAAVVLRPVRPGNRLAREAVLSAAAAAAAASLLAWLGPPGSDLAAHAYQRAVFLQHGFSLWNNFWYAGRYSFVTYSLIYYPLAALLGIRLLAVATVAMAALAFAVVLGREWGPTARWSSRTFAVVWAGIVLSAAFPFALGAALALLTIWALQAGARWRFAALALLTLAASPVAFLLLALVLGGIGLARQGRGSLVPALTVGVAAALELVLWRLFPGGGQFPFSLAEYLAAVTFCVVGAALSWNVDRTLGWITLVYLAACSAAFVVPSAVGENMARLRYAAIPFCVLVLSLRRWRPWPVCLVAFGLAVSWNLSPLVGSFAHGASDRPPRRPTGRPRSASCGSGRHLRTASRRWTRPATGTRYLPAGRDPSRPRLVPAGRLPGQPPALRGSTPSAYLAWLRSLGVRYVVLTDAPPDYSARGEARLLRSGRAGLPVASVPRT